MEIADRPAAAPSPVAPGDYVVRARGLVERAIRRRWEEGLLNRDPDGVFTAMLGAEHVEKLMQPQAPSGPQARFVEFAYDPASPLGDLIRRFHLSPSEADLVAVILSCEVEPAVARLIAYLGGNQAQFVITLDLIFDLVYRPRADRASAAALMHGDLAPHRILRRLRFLIVDGAEGKMTLAQGLRLNPRFTGWLVGGRELDAELTANCRLHAPELPAGEADPHLVAAATAALGGPGRLLLVDGPPRSGRERLIQFAAAQLQRPLLVVSGRGLTPERVVAAFREALLHSALLLFHDAEEGLAGDGMLRFRECLEVYPGSVAVTGLGQSSIHVMQLRPSTTVEVTVPPHGEREVLWATYLGEGHGLSDEQLREVAALYNLGTAGIISAGSLARERAIFEGRAPDRADIALAMRQLFEADLAGIATRLEISQTWEDLVLAEETGESVASIIDRIRYRSEVLGDWGFARKVGKGLGLTVLFSGEPGTGKSMVAGLIAREIGLDLYVVDLGRITSKWLGETEKNLGRAFDAAEAGHVLLLFDEADTILGKRSSDARGANDKYANMSTNFILARLEQFQGVAFFTTNLASMIDPAVSRRMSATVTFPFPDLEMRAELWRRMIPREAPVQDDIDFVKLATDYELSGGFIRNVVLRAAYTAIREGLAIGMSHLDRAAKAEYHDRGSLIVGGRLV